jgi:hypothetical protein
MVDVLRLPDGAFGYVPTPALVGPIEFTMSLADYAALGGYVDEVRDVASLAEGASRKHMSAAIDNPWPLAGKGP